ncbi:DUF6221 family protein [Streptomyces spectabilis]|uniref:DUF6221 family protein n=1 Tax=Streptomyces spectabilis TaxID=68270 RepID=UPI0033FDADA9
MGQHDGCHETKLKGSSDPVDDPVQWYGEQLDMDERAARMASGGTLTGEPGNWTPVPTGDEWEAVEGENAAELLVALRPNLPRPADVMSGMWGAWISQSPDPADPEAGSPMPALVHAALHDPSRVLREIAANRRRLERHTPWLNVGVESDENDPSTYVPACSTCQKTVVHPGDWPCEELRDMLISYADRPGYRADWRP